MEDNLAEITGVSADRDYHGSMIAKVDLRGSGWGVGFGYMIHRNIGEAQAFILDLAEVCGGPPSSWGHLGDSGYSRASTWLIGQKVEALFPFKSAIWGSEVTALRSKRTGLVFSIDEWRKAYYPDVVHLDPLQTAKARALGEIAHHQRRIADEAGRLSKLDEQYTPIVGVKISRRTAR